MTRDVCGTFFLASRDADGDSSVSLDTIGGHGFGRRQIGRTPFDRIRKLFWFAEPGTVPE
jgi:hypothetical protein